MTKTSLFGENTFLSASGTEKQLPIIQRSQLDSYATYRIHFCFSFVCLSVYNMHMIYTLEISDQKRVLDTLELELRLVVSHRVGSGNETWVPSKNTKCF